MKVAAASKATSFGLSDRTDSKVLLIGSSQCKSLTSIGVRPFKAQLEEKVGLNVIEACVAGGWIAEPKNKPANAVPQVREKCKTHQPSLVVLFHGANDVYWNKDGGNGDIAASRGLPLVESKEWVKQEPGLFVNATRTACGADTKIILAQGVVYTKSDTVFNTLREAMQQTAASTAGVIFADMGSWAEIQTRKDQYCRATTVMTQTKNDGELCDFIHFCKYWPNQDCALLREMTTKLANSIKAALGLS